MPLNLAAAELIQQFDWTSEDGKTSISFDVTGLLRAIALDAMPYEKVLAPIDKEWADSWLPLRDLALGHVYNMPKEYAETPVLMVEMTASAANTVEPINGLLIDGSHRYARAILDKKHEIRAHLVRFPHWLPYSKMEQKV